MKKPAVYELRSKLHEIITDSEPILDFETKRDFVFNKLSELKINNTDKQKMMVVVKYQISNLSKLNQYLYNALMKFEGNGVI